MKEFQVNIRPGSSILGNYKNQSYKIESAFAEFIDNSTQSFFTHKEEFLQIGQTACNISIEIYPEYIKIYDNAYGMEIDDFKRALKLDSPPEDKSGRCEKGMGLKTSATCLGSLWSVETTQKGSKNKYKAEVDVDEITRNSPEQITATVEECDENEHYTIIKIEMLNKKIGPGKIDSLIKSLSEMYSLDIRNKELTMTVNKIPVKYQKPDLWINQETGNPEQKWKEDYIYSKLNLYDMDRDEEFKKMIVNLCETSSDKTMSDIAREYGVSRTNITSWRKKYGTITTSPGITTSNDEILKLQKKNRELEIENEILKKAVSIFSKK